MPAHGVIDIPMGNELFDSSSALLQALVAHHIIQSFSYDDGESACTFRISYAKWAEWAWEMADARSAPQPAQYMPVPSSGSTRLEIAADAELYQQLSPLLQALIRKEIIFAFDHQDENPETAACTRIFYHRWTEISGEENPQDALQYRAASPPQTGESEDH